MPQDIIITEEFDGTKPKNFINKNTTLPYYKIFKYIKEKRITINKKKIKEDTILKAGDILTFWANDIVLKNHEKEKTQKTYEAKNLGLDVLEETKEFVVFNKLPGVVVQGANDNELSLPFHLSWYKKKLNDSSDFNYFHVHRIDKGTSGCLVVAKTRKALRELNELFKNREVKKTYHCLCFGEFQKKQGTVSLNLERAEQGEKQKMKISNSGKKSISHFKILKEFTYQGEIFSLVEVEIETGLMHQIRVHMKYLKHPIIGDIMYGNMFANSLFEDKVQRQFLHAQKIEFEYENKKHSVIAPYTKDLNNILKLLSEKTK